MFEFTPLDRDTLDLQARAYSRVMQQFKRSKLLLAVMGAINTEVQTLYDAITTVQYSFYPDTAVGAQQDVLGRILGIVRKSGYRYEDIDFLTEDADIIDFEDGTDFLLDTGFTPNSYDLSDYDYRKALMGKAHRNFCKYSSVNEVQDYFKLVFSLVVNPVLVGPMEVELQVPVGTPDALKALLAMTKATSSSDLAYYAPLSATLSVTVVEV